MGKIFFCGDTHGGSYNKYHRDDKKLTDFNDESLSKEDVLIQLGDFGYIWFHESHPKRKKDEAYLDELNKRNFTTVFVDGNHENFDLLYKYEEIEMFGGKVHKIRDSIFHLKRGEVYIINGKTIFVMGGASSNKDQKEMNYKGKGRFRKEKLQKSWWKEEIPSEEEFLNGLKNINKIKRFDYILSHTAPTFIIKEMIDLLNIEKEKIERFKEPVALYLEDVYNKVEKFSSWHFGHFHVDCEIKTEKGLFCCHMDSIVEAI